MKLRNSLNYAILAGLSALVQPSRTASSDLDFMLPRLTQFTITLPLEKRLRSIEGMETWPLLRISNYDEYIRAASSEYPEISPSHLYSMIYQESRGNSRARSPKKAVGLMQITPITQRHLGITRIDAFNPETAIRKGTEYFSELLDHYNGNEILALAAYNSGPGRINTLLTRKGLSHETATYENFGRFLNKETRNYIMEVLINRERIEQVYL